MSGRLFLSIGEAMVELGRSDATEASGRPLWRLGYAGDVLNTLWYVRARLPAAGDAGWNAALFTDIGADPFSVGLSAFLTDNGIGTEFVATRPDRNIGLYAIELTPDGERRFSYWRSHSAARRLADDADRLREALGRAEIVYFSGITLAILPNEGRLALLDLLGKEKANGRRIVFDPNIRPALWEDEREMRRWTEAGCAVCAVGLPSFEDEARFWGDADPEDCARRWRGYGVAEVVVKNAGAAIAFATDDDAGSLEVDRVRPVDTTGAGDAFNGGYLAARIAGADIRAAIANGHDLASCVVSHPGALIPMTLARERFGPAGARA